MKKQILTTELDTFSKSVKNIPINIFFINAIVDWIQNSPDAYTVKNILNILKTKNKILYKYVEYELAIQICNNLSNLK